jgi:hypothetical protein
VKRMDTDYHAVKIVMAAMLSKWDEGKSRKLKPDSYWLEAAEVALRTSAPTIRSLERERLQAGLVCVQAICHHEDGWEHPSDGSLPCTLERPAVVPKEG